MKVGIPVLVALTALVAGAAIVRSRTREEVPRPAPRAAAPSAAVGKPLPVPVSSCGTQAVGLVRLFREQRALRTGVAPSGFSEEQLRRLRTIDQSLTDEGLSLSAALRGDFEAWRDVIALLSGIEDYDCARDVVLRIRPAVDPAAEALWADRLQTAPAANDRRLALVALAGRSSRVVILALVRGAQDDADPHVRSEALAALAEACRGPLAEDLARMAKETLIARASAETDPAVRQAASAMAEQGRPVRTSTPRRPSAIRGPRSPAQTP